MTLPALDLSLSVLLAVVFVAGIARGLSGFGSGMIVGPVAAALYGPTAAIAILVIIDSLPALPVTIPVMRITRWREVVPVLIGMMILFPLGIWILTHGDVIALRWTIAIAIFGSVAVLLSGYRYRGPRNAATSLTIGGVSGLLSGIASIPGPPVIAYWIASDLPAAIIRANLLSLFLLSDCISIVNVWAAGLFNAPVVTIGFICTPVYFAGLMLGGRFFGLASETTYRRATFALVLLAGFLALPIFDEAFARLAALMIKT